MDYYYNQSQSTQQDELNRSSHRQTETNYPGLFNYSLSSQPQYYNLPSQYSHDQIQAHHLHADQSMNYELYALAPLNYLSFGQSRVASYPYHNHQQMDQQQEFYSPSQYSPESSALTSPHLYYPEQRPTKYRNNSYPGYDDYSPSIQPSYYHQDQYQPPNYHQQELTHHNQDYFNQNRYPISQVSVHQLHSPVPLTFNRSSMLIEEAVVQEEAFEMPAIVAAIAQSESGEDFDHQFRTPSPSTPASIPEDDMNYDAEGELDATYEEDQEMVESKPSRPLKSSRPSKYSPRAIKTSQSPEADMHFSSTIKPFIAKLTYLLRSTALYGDIFTWNAAGTHFIFNWNHESLSTDLLPLFFAHKSVPAFQRQLNVYGFQRLDASKVTETVDANPALILPLKSYVGYSHPIFRRDNSDAKLALLLAKPSKARTLKKEAAQSKSSSPKARSSSSLSLLKPSLTTNRSRVAYKPRQTVKIESSGSDSA